MTAPALDLETMAATLSASPDFRVLRKFVPRTSYAEEQWNLGEKSHARRALYIDCETTDRDATACDIMELGAVQFSYDAETGQVFSITDEYQGFEEPTRPIDPEAFQKHGISLDMVKGKRLDDARVIRLATESQLVIAHNAAFDRQVIERRFADFAGKHFACSYRDVPWEPVFGCENSKLSTVLAHTCGEFYSAHRALDDCRVGVHVLAAARSDRAASAMSCLLDNARKPIVRVWASGSPFESKDALKARGYKWAAAVKTWYRDCREEDADDEQDWLIDHAGVRMPKTTTIDAKDKYSIRAER